MTAEERNRLEQAVREPAGRDARIAVVRSLADTLRPAGTLLWTFGYTIGNDRRDGESPFGFGSDAAVGLALLGRRGRLA